jgi:hypothetical protein
MLRWWRSVSTRGRVLIALFLLLTGGLLLLVGVAWLGFDGETSGGAPAPSASASVVPPTTLTTVATVPGLSGTASIRTVTITESATTVQATAAADETSGTGRDTTIAVALISAGALIMGSAITATSAIVVAKVSKHA